MNENEGLRKELSERQLTMITLGGVIGAGLLVGSGSAIHANGPAVIVSYILAAGLIVLVMRQLAEMAVAHPSSGSFAVYAGDALGEWASYAIGWIYWYFWVIVIAFEATAGAATLHQLLPGIPVWIAAIVLLLMFYGVNMVSVKNFGEFEYWFALIKVVTIIIFLICGAVAIIGLFPGFDSPGIANLTGRGGFFPMGLSAVATGFMIVIFPFIGIEMVAIAAAETPNPKEAVHKALNTVIWRLALFYVGSITVIACLIPWDSTDILKSPFVVVFENLGIPYAGTLMTLVVLTAVLSCLNSGLYTSSRMIYGIAETGAAPKIFTRTNKAGVPIVSLTLSVGVAVVFTLFNYISPEVVFNFLLNASGSVGLLVYAVIGVSQIILRRRAQQEGKELAVKMWGFPYLTYLAIAGIVYVIVVMILNPAMRVQVTTSGIVLALILLTYPIFKKRKAKDAPSEDALEEVS
ncbi:MAG: amino acid permease [Syntrophomonadaceae bacterium]|nr:amino acid permease [Syntrophomonadaceae bacterium]